MAGESASALDRFLRHFVYEGWITYPTQRGAREGYVAKLNFVIKF